MKRALLIALLLMAACAKQAQTQWDLDDMVRNYNNQVGAAPATEAPAPQTAPQTATEAAPASAVDTGDSCRMADYANLVGRPSQQIERSSLPAGARMICFGCMVTQDFAPARLNLQLDPQGRVASLKCG